MRLNNFSLKNSNMKGMGDASYVIGIKIFRDGHRSILGLSKETYINEVLERFWMKNYLPLSVASIMKRDKFNLNQRPRNDFQSKQIKNIQYASVVGSLILKFTPSLT